MAPEKVKKRPKGNVGTRRASKTPSHMPKNKNTGIAAQSKSSLAQKKAQKGKQVQHTSQERKSNEKQGSQIGLEDDDDSDSFPNFAEFRKAHVEGYNSLSQDDAHRFGRPLGPDRAAYGMGCFSKGSYVADLPYPEAIRTSPWDSKKTQENLTHKVLRGVAASRYTQRGGQPSPGQTECKLSRLSRLLPVPANPID